MRRWRELPWPLIVELASFASGFGLIAAGVYELFGSGWAKLAAAVPFLLLSVVIMRGS